jgi:hypothetical protein
MEADEVVERVERRGEDLELMSGILDECCPFLSF